MTAPACNAPWVSLEFDPSGWVYACCASHLYPLGRVGTDRLADLWNGPRAEVLKEALRRNDLTVACASCRWHLEHGRTDTDAAVYDEYPLSDASPNGPRAMTFALSNRCNLGCVMCSPELSSTLRHRAGLPVLHNPYDESFFEDLEPLLAGLVYAKFLGGEPFLVEEHHRVWDLMAAVGAPERIQVTTNGTIWNDRVEDLLDRFRVDVTVSVDAVTPTAYEGIRSGADHSAVLRNIDRFRQRCVESATELRLCFCLMDRNWVELAPFLAWADELDAAVTVNLVSDTGLALHDLPAPLLEEIRAVWEQQDATVASGLRTTAGIWRTQRHQLDAVLDERRRRALASPRQPTSSGAIGAEWARVDEFDPVPLHRLVEERDRLAAWAGGGPIGEMRFGADGTVTAVKSPLDRLGITPAAVGGRLDGLDGRMTVADGRECWVVDQVDRGGMRVRTLVLSTSRPARGSRGKVVRIVIVPLEDGGVLLAAEDDTYDGVRATVVEVNAGSRRSDRGDGRPVVGGDGIGR